MRYKYILQRKIKGEWIDENECTWKTLSEVNDFVKYYKENYFSRSMRYHRIIRLQYQTHKIIYF